MGHSATIGIAALATDKSEKSLSGSIRTWVRTGLVDPEWDRFLQSTPLGQYHQSTAWANLKALEGWEAVRYILAVDGTIVGGFQVLSRGSGMRHVGYVSKGPVLLPEHSQYIHRMNQMLRDAARELGLVALVIQPPDLSPDGTLPGGEFPVFELGKVHDATWVLDLAEFEAVHRGFSKTTRTQLRRAARHGFTTRTGGREDLGTFFALMSSTCARAGVEANPPTEDHLYTLWDHSPAGSLHLYFVQKDGEPVAGELCFAFGQTLTLWKTGWNGEERHHHPVELGVASALRGACESGRYKLCDFSSFDRQVGEKILRGEEWDRNQLHGRHQFHMRFGGRPLLLPPAHIYIPNPFLRLAYRLAAPLKRLQRRYARRRPNK